MSEHCVLKLVDEKFDGAVAEYLKFKEQWRGFAGSEQLVCRFFWRWFLSNRVVSDKRQSFIIVGLQLVDRSV